MPAVPMRGRTTQNVVSATANLAADRSSWTTTTTRFLSSRRLTDTTLPMITSL